MPRNPPENEDLGDIQGTEGDIRKYDEGRACTKCSAILTMYNPNDECFCHPKEMPSGRWANPSPLKNKKKHKNPTGVSLQGGKWRATINFKDKFYHIGSYSTKEYACKKRELFKLQLLSTLGISE